MGKISEAKTGDIIFIDNQYIRKLNYTFIDANWKLIDKPNTNSCIIYPNEERYFHSFTSQICECSFIREEVFSEFKDLVVDHYYPECGNYIDNDHTLVFRSKDLKKLLNASQELDFAKWMLFYVDKFDYIFVSSTKGE